MSNKLIVPLLLMLSYYSPKAQPYWSSLEPGKHSVGLKTFQRTTKEGNAMLISVWYPAENSDAKTLSVADMILMANPIDPMLDSSRFSGYRKPLKWMFGQTIADHLFQEIISHPTRTVVNAKMKSGKFSLIIAHSEVASYFPTFELFASYGYIVVGIDGRLAKKAPSAPYHYSPHTDMGEEAMEYFLNEPYIDPSDVSVFGHGFGIQPALYLAMRSSVIKRAINFDGGFFGPRSNSTTSIDYNPANLKCPLLHIITIDQFKMDDAAQFNALQNPITRVKIKSDLFKHQDASVFGRIYQKADIRDDSTKTIVERTYYEIHEVMLQFLLNKTFPQEPAADLEIEQFR